MKSSDFKLKNAIASLVCLNLMACGGGTPSVSVQPSEDYFEAAGKELTAKMDILFVVDNSVSMREEQENMMANFSKFIKNFVGKGYDYRIAVVGTDAWITKGFYDSRSTQELPKDPENYVLMSDFLNSNQQNDSDVQAVGVKGSGNSLSVDYDPMSYPGFSDLNFKSGQSGRTYYHSLCSRNNYITSRFSEGDYTKALLGSDRGTHNGEANQNKRTPDYRYLSGYRIVSSDNPTIDNDFYLSGGEDDRDYSILRNREESFYDLADVSKPAGKSHILDIFRNNIMQGLDGCFGESGLESAKVALENPFNQNIDGKAFPREDAHLAIIVVSDMRDEMAGIRSGNNRVILPNYELGNDTTDRFSEERMNHYHNFFQSISSETYGYTLHSIVPTGEESVELSDRYSFLESAIPTANAPADPDCSTDAFDKEYCYVAYDNQNEENVTANEISSDEVDDGCVTEYSKNVGGNRVPREAKMYTKLTEKTGGQKSSICGDFASKLEDIAQIIIERTIEFKLEKQPQSVDLLTVSVKSPNDSDFQDIPRQSPNGSDGWTYNESGNSIVFHGEDIPAQGSELLIVYDRDSLR